MANSKVAGIASTEMHEDTNDSIKGVWQKYKSDVNVIKPFAHPTKIAYHI